MEDLSPTAIAVSIIALFIAGIVGYLYLNPVSSDTDSFKSALNTQSVKLDRMSMEIEGINRDLGRLGSQLIDTVDQATNLASEMETLKRKNPNIDTEYLEDLRDDLFNELENLDDDIKDLDNDFDDFVDCVQESDSFEEINDCP